MDRVEVVVSAAPPQRFVHLWYDAPFNRQLDELRPAICNGDRAGCRRHERFVAKDQIGERRTDERCVNVARGKDVRRVTTLSPRPAAGTRVRSRASRLGLRAGCQRSWMSHLLHVLRDGAPSASPISVSASYEATTSGVAYVSASVSLIERPPFYFASCTSHLDPVHWHAHIPSASLTRPSASSEATTRGASHWPCLGSSMRVRGGSG
jgi:hypothetical protein